MDAKKIGTFIKELRIQKNMTQKELAEAINCTDKAISRWETGRGVPEVSLLIPLSKSLNVSVNELLSGERFIPELKTGKQEEHKALIMVPEIISKSDETIVDVITEKENELRKIKKETVLFMILCCVQVILFFGVPTIWQMYKGWDAAEFMVLASMINAFLVGLVDDKTKWIFPFFGTLVIISSIIFGDGEELMGILFSLYFAIGAAIIMVISSVVRLAVKLVKQKIK